MLKVGPNGQYKNNNQSDTLTLNECFLNDAHTVFLNSLSKSKSVSLRLL